MGERFQKGSSNLSESEQSTGKPTGDEGPQGEERAMRAASEGFPEELHLALSLSPRLKAPAHC